MQLYHISIPAKPHIAPFAHKRYGSPVHINANSTLGILIKSLLQNRHFKTKFTLSDRDLRFKYLTHHIQCAVPYSHLVYNQFYNLTPDNILAINQFLEEEFKERLYYHCQVSANWQCRRAGIDDAIQSFTDFYGISIDNPIQGGGGAITFDALKKMEYRYRQKMQKNIFTEMSPHLLTP